MRGTPIRAVLVAAALALVATATAYAIEFEVDHVAVSATMGVEPREYPAQGDLPVELSSTTRVMTKDGSAPPVLEKLTFLFDANGRIDTRGLPVCTLAKLRDTTPAVARKRCRSALVGQGSGRAEVNLPGQGPIRVASPLTLFNAPPVDGRPALIVHAYETLPVAKTLLIPFTVQRVRHGRYGYKVEIEMPPIAEGFGAATLAEATVGATWKRGGRTAGYLSARCAGGRFQVYGTARFSDGSFFPVVLTSPCHVSA